LKSKFSNEQSLTGRDEIKTVCDEKVGLTSKLTTRNFLAWTFKRKAGGVVVVGRFSLFAAVVQEK
jgi:hypothetical protein